MKEVEAKENLRFKIRHSAAHVMAEAVLNLFPGTKVGIGPPTHDGFYYDFDCSEAFTAEHLKKIEKEMKRIIKSQKKFSGVSVSRKIAREKFKDQKYKLEIIDGIPEEEEITIWNHETWEDICRGGHVESTNQIPAFKLLDVAGAYWRGNEKNPMLQRIYGTAWESKDALKSYLSKLEEAAKRDHRKLGTSLELFYFDPMAPSMPFFYPKGAKLLNLLMDYMRQKYQYYEYQEVMTPQIFDSKLWDLSGHSEHFKENMFFTETENRTMGLKPMNCPAHYLIFRSQLHSYRDLPVRLADFGRLHRNERSGVSHGLTRVKSFSQDDAHIFCRFDQIEDEIKAFLSLLEEIYQDFGFEEPLYHLSLRPKERSGTDQVWDESEKIMKKILDNSNKKYLVQEGEGAFYGPKIDVMIPDAIGREWQLGTVQLDFFAAKKFKLNYFSNESQKQEPIVIHRAIFGSLERFLGILIEHYGGAFPFWLSPTQYILIPISENQFSYCDKVNKELSKFGLRGNVDKTSDRLNAKIRKAQLNKTPLMIICGDKEVDSDSLTIRFRDGENVSNIKTNALNILNNDPIKIKNDETLLKLLKP
ncbi:MAG: threonine--tRNA ligase [Chloroflexota bacterium]